MHCSPYYQAVPLTDLRKTSTLHHYHHLQVINVAKANLQHNWNYNKNNGHYQVMNKAHYTHALYIHVHTYVHAYIHITHNNILNDYVRMCVNL